MRFLLLLVITLLSFPVVGQETWDQVKSDSNITFYTKQGLFAPRFVDTLQVDIC